MKLCRTCGRSHPDDVSTSHHPTGCKCMSYTLHAADGNNQGPGGCIWMRVIKKSDADPEMERLRLILEYEKQRNNDESEPKGKVN